MLKFIGGLILLSLILGSGWLMTNNLVQSETKSSHSLESLSERISQLEATRASVQTISEQTVSANSPLIPINQADQALLEELPGIGPVRASNILSEREQGGPYRDINDLDKRVSSVPNSVLEDISSKITFE